jgi:hypothetical protein
MTIHFTDKNSKRVYDQFLMALDSRMKSLKKTDRLEMQQELTSHIYESMVASPAHTEVEKLLDAIEKLGDLDNITSPVVADYMIQYSGSTLNPNTLFSAFQANKGRKIRRFVIGTVLLLFFVLTCCFLTISLLKLFRPEMGLYIGKNVFVLGTVDGQSPAREILGYWIIPITGLLTMALYWLVSRSLKLLLIKK